MCTAISLNTGHHYFGRTLDLEYAFCESVVITPRCFPLPMRRMPDMPNHLAMIGIASVQSGYPLYYDAANESGLSAAALNFPGNAHYDREHLESDNIAPFEFIPWILGQCASVSQARALLARMNLAAIPFSDTLPLSPLHFLISDAGESIVVEPMADGIHIFDNPLGVLTNNPPFDYQMTNLSNYMALRSGSPENLLDLKLPLAPYSHGMGALGLPGDLSSASRFVRAAFFKTHSLCGRSEEESVSQFFHILSSVSHVRGGVMIGDKPEITLYSSCCSTQKGIYYYTTYENQQITAIDMHRESLDSHSLIIRPLIREQQIKWQN